ncbi:MAG: VOC family protein [Alphaproteobacteria bacterium]
MIPVLSVTSIEDAKAFFTKKLPFADVGKNHLAYGEDVILLVQQDIWKNNHNITPYHFDHIAFKVIDLDSFAQKKQKQGLKLDANYTADGITSIKEFWQEGVRFIFFKGPDNVPIEFCSQIDGSTTTKGIDHLGVRTQNLDKAQKDFAHLEARIIAEYQLDGDNNVCFFTANNKMIEAFTAAGHNGMHNGLGWVGYIAQ